MLISRIAGEMNNHRAEKIMLDVTDYHMSPVEAGEVAQAAGVKKLVLVHVVLPTDFELEGLSQLDKIRAQTQEDLSKAHVATIVDVLFTSDRQWGAPMSDGGAGSTGPSQQ